MQSCSSAHSVLILLLMIFITGSVSAVHVVKVKYGGAAVLPCTEKCSGVVIWTPTHKSTDILAQCDQTSCRSVKEGYQMIYNQYLQGNLSLIITEVDFSKRGLYTCDCDDVDKCDTELQIKTLKTTVLIKPGDPLVMELDVSDSVEVIYNSTESVDGSSDQICTVIGGSLQCKPEYKSRTSVLSSSSVLELRDMKESDSGVYIIRIVGNKVHLHIYTVTVTDSSFPAWAIVLIIVLLLLLLVVVVLVCKGKEIKKCLRGNQDLKSNNEERENITLEPNKTIQDPESKNEERENITLEPTKTIQELQAENQQQKRQISLLKKVIKSEKPESEKTPHSLPTYQTVGLSVWPPETASSV